MKPIGLLVKKLKLWSRRATKVDMIVMRIKEARGRVNLARELRIRKSNMIYDYIVGIFTGTSSYGAYIVHVVNHHKQNDKIIQWR